MSVHVRRRGEVKNQREHHPAGSEPKSQPGLSKRKDLKDLSEIPHWRDCVKAEITFSEGGARGRSRGRRKQQARKQVSINKIYHSTQSPLKFFGSLDFVLSQFYFRSFRVVAAVFKLASLRQME